MSKEKGTVNWFSQSKGYGFITKEAGGDIFVHASSLTDTKELAKGDLVEFEVGSGRKGPEAKEVTKL